MSRILCPECGTRISENARICPYCGFQDNSLKKTIGEMGTYQPIPIFYYEMEGLDLENNNYAEITEDNNREIFDFFGKWENIVMYIPDLADAIKDIAERETYLVADYDKYTAELIAKKVYRFLIDKDGKILPSIYDGKSIVKQVRLREMNLSPRLNVALSNLLLHAHLAIILDEIECVKDEISRIHRELQDDRLALAESAGDKLQQSRKIHDARLREMVVLEAISSATDAKRILMRNFSENKRFLEQHHQKSTLQMTINRKGEKVAPERAEDAFQDLIALTNAVIVECSGYDVLGEHDACMKCLKDFDSFIYENDLDGDTLKMLNERLKTNKKNPSIIKEFSRISRAIKDYNKKYDELPFKSV